MSHIAVPGSPLGEQMQFQLLHLYRKCFEVHGGTDLLLEFLKLNALFGFYNFFCQLIQRMDWPYRTITRENKTQLLQSAATWEFVTENEHAWWRQRLFYHNNKIQVISHLLEAGGDPNRKFVDNECHYRTPFSWTLEFLFINRILPSTGGNGRSSGQQVERVLQSFLESSADLRTAMLLSYYISDENKLLVSDAWQYSTDGLRIVVEVNCAWLVRALAEKFKLYEGEEQVLVPWDVEIEPESRIVQVFWDYGKKHLTESALESFLADESNSLSIQGYCPELHRRMYFRHDEMEAYKAKLVDILSKAKSLGKGDNLAGEPVYDWFIRKGYMTARDNS